MNLKELIKSAKEDLKIDSTNLHKEAERQSDLFLKYREILSMSRISLKDYEIKLARLIIFKRQYYSGSAPTEVYEKDPFDLRLRKAEVDEYIKNDDEIISIDKEICVLEEKISFIEDLLSQIKSRSWEIKSSIAWQKFLAGE